VAIISAIGVPIGGPRRGSIADKVLSMFQPAGEVRG
jgi:hypothetical protein